MNPEAAPRAHDLVVNRWGARFLGRRIPCSIGRGGIVREKREGDGGTPVGGHDLEYLFVRAERVRLRAPALGQRAPGPRDGWSEDPGDPRYNTLVRRPHGWPHERLRRADPLYNIIGVLDWNRHPARPGAGSAIFLHLWRRPRYPTAGCVAFRLTDLKWILARWRPSSRLILRG